MKKNLILMLLLIMIFAPYANAEPLIGVNRLTDELVSIDILTGAGTVIGSTLIPNDSEDYGKAITSLAYDPLLNVFYAVDNNNVGGMHLLKIYPETWNGEVIGNLGILSVHGLAFDPINRILYGVEATGIPFNNVPNLISIDISTGSLTHIGDLAIPPNNPFFGLAYNISENVLYASTESFYELFEINPSNANVSFIGTLGMTQDITGLTYDDSSGVLHGISDTYLFSIDIQTGAGTIIGPHNQSEITCLALATPTSVTPVTVDIKPGSKDNCININGHGVIPVAILGSADFDVTNINVDTLLFNGSNVQVRGKKDKTMCHYEDVSGDFTYPEGSPDGHLDLVCQFEDDPGQWVPGQAEATLTGELIDGTPIEGTDSICIVP